VFVTLGAGIILISNGKISKQGDPSGDTLTYNISVLLEFVYRGGRIFASFSALLKVE